MIDPRFVFVFGLSNVVGGVGYAADAVRGRSMPNRATFLMWAVAPSIAFAAEVRQGAGLSSVATLGAGLVPAAIFAASFINRGAYWRLGILDYGCGTLSAVALVLWQITGRGTVAIVFSVLADLLAAIPTVVKAWRAPETETGWAYLLSGLNGVGGVLTAPTLTIDAIAFPLYLVLICGVIWALTLRSGAGAIVAPKVASPMASPGIAAPPHRS